MANRTPIYTLLSLSWLACRPLALQVSAPPGALISIAGRPKCGTSHLHVLLSSHHDVFSLRKETCPEEGKMDNASFAQYLSFTASRAQAADGSWLKMGSEEVLEACIKNFGQNSEGSCRFFYDEAVSGGSKKTTRVLTSCLQPWHASFMPPASIANVRVLWSQRDPADLYWASYNFWVTQADAAESMKGTNGEWTGKLNYRSPKHFHELVASKGMLNGGVNSWFHFLEVPYMRSMRETYGQDQVLFLRSEDLKLRDTIKKICDFVGLDIDGIDQKLIDSKTNAQGSLDDRGWGANSDGVDGQEGRYEISGNQPMLCETRKLIYNQARDICSTLDKEFGLHYEMCLDPNPACPPACP